MGQPQVSVVLPVWNGERYLRQAIESILEQDFKNFELVIVNDGSTDGTASILAEYSADERVRVHTQSNQGVVNARNTGLQLARAELIAFQDADDLSAPDRLSKQVEFLESHPEVAVIGGAMMHITQANQSIRLEVFPTGRVNVARALGAGCAIAQPTVMVRKSAALAVGGYRLPFCNGAEDYDLWLRISEHHPVDNLPYTLTLYRIHSTSFTLTNAPEQAFAALVARCSYRRRIAGLPDPLEGKSTSLTLDELNLLNLNEHEEGGFMPAIFTMLIKQQASPEKVLAWLNRAWQLRAHQRRGRLVRHVLAPGAFMLAKFGYTKASLVWFTRAFMTEPFSACWLFMRRRN